MCVIFSAFWLRHWFSSVVYLKCTTCALRVHNKVYLCVNCSPDFRVKSGKFGHIFANSGNPEETALSRL